MTATAILRVIGAAAALVSGYAHLTLYNDGYKDFPMDIGGVAGVDLGQQFLLNVLGAIAIALGLVVPLFVRVPDLVWKLAALGGIAWAALSLVAFYLAHETSAGWFGWESTEKPSPESALAVFSEIIVIVTMVILLALTTRPRRVIGE